MEDHHEPGELEAMPRARRLEYAIEQLSELQQRLYSAQKKVKKISQVLHLEEADQYEEDTANGEGKKDVENGEEENKDPDIKDEIEKGGVYGEDEGEEEEEKVEDDIIPSPAKKRRSGRQCHRCNQDGHDVQLGAAEKDVEDMENQLEHEEAWASRIAEFEQTYGWRPATPPRPPP